MVRFAVEVLRVVAFAVAGLSSSPLQAQDGRVHIPVWADFEEPARKPDWGSPEGLVRFLTGRTGPLFRPILGGVVVDDRDAGVALVRFGEAAVPHIIRGLEEMRADGVLSKGTSGAYWLLYALARIERGPAYERLRPMLLDPGLRPIEDALEDAIAVSLQLTSFRCSLHGSTVKIPIGFHRPQNALDQLALAWVLDDREAFEATLGPRAKRSLDTLLISHTWEKLRARLLRESLDGVVGFGYRLPLPPEVVGFIDPLDRPTSVSGKGYDRYPETTAEFYEWNRPCGKVTVRFLDLQDGPLGKPHWVVDNDDIGKLLASLSSCLFLPAKRNPNQADSDASEGNLNQTPDISTFELFISIRRTASPRWW